MAQQIGATISAWAGRNPIRPLPSFEPRLPPSAKTAEICGKLGLRFPPANSVDREAHAARVALLAEDCADVPENWLDEAASQWAKSQPFFPRACELRDNALDLGAALERSLQPKLPSTPAWPPSEPVAYCTPQEARAIIAEHCPGVYRP